MSAALATARPDQIAWRFLRLVGLIVFALIVGVSAWWLRTDPVVPAGWFGASRACGYTAGFMALGLSCLAPMITNKPAVFRALCAGGGIAGIAAGAIALITQLPGVNTITLMMILAGQVSSALLIGSITVAWLLGHAYLTATRMTIAPLRRFCWLIGWAVGLRWLFITASLAAGWWLTEAAGADFLSRLAAQWLALSFRVVTGLLAVSVFAYMVADCVRLRSTQSATGILYFGSILAYVGELASQYLTRQLDWPM